MKAQMIVTIESKDGHSDSLAGYCAAIARNWALQNALELIILGYAERLRDEGLLTDSDQKVKFGIWEEMEEDEDERE